jgi:hypothetical protein
MIQSILNYLLPNPLIILYLLQAITYGVAAEVSRRSGHGGLTVCYAINSLLYVILGVCHTTHSA